MKATGPFTAVAVMAFLWGGCASAPSYPEPQDGNGQILVKLEGEPKEGLLGLGRWGAPDDYDIKREEGGAFERVDYGHLPDVVVVADPGRALPVDSSAPAPAAAELELDEDGFSRVQLLAAAGGRSGHASLTLLNRRSSAVHLYGFNETDASFEATVGANARTTVAVSETGRYDIFCDEDESLHCVLFVTDRPAWIGSSDSGAFFDELLPQEYMVTVFPPRLPKWSRKVTVTAGKRATLTARLTVNNLPKVGQ
ncbi:MAG: hypothetical protein ACYS0E_04485 [Planctomycetota bacterium]|jgi:hypothetical protein